MIMLERRKMGRGEKLDDATGFKYQPDFLLSFWKNQIVRDFQIFSFLQEGLESYEA